MIFVYCHSFCLFIFFVHFVFLLLFLCLLRLCLFKGWFTWGFLVAQFTHSLSGPLVSAVEGLRPLWRGCHFPAFDASVKGRFALVGFRDFVVIVVVVVDGSEGRDAFLCLCNVCLSYALMYLLHFFVWWIEYLQRRCEWWIKKKHSFGFRRTTKPMLN